MLAERETSTGSWGTTYVGTGNPEIARRAVEDALSCAGMHCRTTRIGEQCVVVDGKQRAPSHHILLRRLHQRVKWRIESSDGTLRLSSDFFFFRWYSAVLAMLWAIIGSCFVFDYLNAERHWLAGSTGSLVASGLLLLAISLMPVVIYLIGALGGRSGDRLWLSVVHKVEKSEGCLAPVGVVNLRYSIYLIGFFVFALALTLWFLTYSLRHSTLPLPRGAIAFLVTLGGLITLLIVTVGLMLARRGFNQRTYPILTGLMTMLSALFLLQASLLPWWMSSGVDYGTLGTNLRPFGFLLLGTSFFLAAMVLYLFFYYVVYSTAVIRPQIMRLHSHRGVGTYRLAVGGEPPLIFQTVFFFTWMLLTGLFLTSLALLVACAIQGVIPLFEQRELQLVHLSSQALAAVLGLAPDNRFLSIIVPGLWWIFALLGVGLLLASTSQLYVRRRALRCRLAAAADRPFPRRQELERMLAKFCHLRRLPLIRLALRPGPPGQAGSERFRLWRTERYVTISEGSLQLPTAQLQAALAHECAHHDLRHLAVRTVALWLGRLSLAGDGFVFALLDSFNYEKKADHAAVTTLGAPQDGLKDLLRLLDPEEFISAPPMTNLNPSLEDRWSLFLEQYRGGFRYHYWHPVAEERIEALRRLG